MNLQSVVVVLLRIVSIHIFVDSLIRVAPYIESYSSVQALGNANSSTLTWYWLLLATCVACAIICWVKAVTIARLATRGLSQEISLGSLSLADCYSVAFVGIGLSFAVGRLPSVLYVILSSLYAAATTPSPFLINTVFVNSVWQTFLPFAIGIILLFKGRKWAVALSQRDTRRPDIPAGTEGQ